MSDKAVKKLVEVLPSNQRVHGKEKIKQAINYGWYDIEFWDDKQPHTADLVGYNAQGKFDFIPNVEP